MEELMLEEKEDSIIIENLWEKNALLQ